MAKKPPPAKAPKGDSFVQEMDEFAKELMGLAKGATKLDEGAVSLQTRLDVFRQLAAWVAIKNRLNEADDGGALDELKRRITGTGPPSAGKARGDLKFKPHAAAWAQHGSKYPDGNGGSALDAIKRALPRPDAGDDDGAGDGS